MLYYIYISIVALAFLSSLVSFRLDYPFHLKLFSVLLGCTLATEIFVHFFLHLVHLKTNLPVYNVFMLVEFWAYAFYYRCVINNNIVKKIIAVYLLLFPLFWVYTCFYVFSGIGSWNSYLIIAGFTFTVLCSVIFCYQLFTSTELINFRVCSEFWIAIGLIIFYTCNLPYLGMYYFITANFNALAHKLKYILQPTDIVMYSIFIYAFLCRMTNTMKSL